MGTIYTNQPKYQVHGMFTCHPDWNSNKMDYDYSILTLNSEVDVNDADVSFTIWDYVYCYSFQLKNVIYRWYE